MFNPNLIQKAYLDNTLRQAISNNNLAVAEQVIKNGADVNAKAWAGDTPLHMAVNHGNADITLLLIKNGADVNAKNWAGNTPLHNATKHGNTDMAGLLIKNGADVNAVNPDEETPLHNTFALTESIGAINTRIDMATLLLENGADINKQNIEGKTVAHQLYHTDDINITKLLTNHKADFNIQDANGKTILHSLTNRWNLADLELLLKNGANPNIKDNDNDYPLNITGNLNIARLLIDHGAETLDQETHRAPLINRLIQEKASELTHNLNNLSTLPDDISQLALTQKTLVTHLTTPYKAGSLDIPRDLLNNKNLIDYMREEKPNLLQFALEYHEDKIFGRVANPVLSNNSLQAIALSMIIKNIPENNALKTAYENAKSIFDLTNGSVFKQQQQQNQVAIKIQALGRGVIARNSKPATRRQSIFR